MGRAVKDQRAWYPLDANFWRDEKVLRAGERAAVLYLAILGQIRLTGAQGLITEDEISHLGIPGYQPRLERLVRVQLIAPTVERVYHVPAWESWHSNKSRAAYMRAWRERAQPRLSSVEDTEDDSGR